MKVKVTFIEHTTYEHVFEIAKDLLPFETEKLSESEISQVLEEEYVFEQMTVQDWLGGEITLREILACEVVE